MTGYSEGTVMETEQSNTHHIPELQLCVAINRILRTNFETSISTLYILILNSQEYP